MGLFNRKKKSNLNEWMKTAKDQELADAYEQRRLRWLEDGQCGTGERTPEMEMLNREINRRSEEKWEKDSRRNKDPNYRWTDANRWDKD